MTTLSPILTAAEMKACDSHTINSLGIPSQILMERAARKAAALLLSRRDLFPEGEILLLCGSGNNGGDGLAMARFLADGSLGNPRPCRVIYTGRWVDGVPDPTRMSPECARQYRLAAEAGVPILPSPAAEEALKTAAVVVDAVFGVGLDRPVEGEIAALLTAVAASALPVLAVDIPSGVHADTGRVMGVALPAVATATMQALKRGLLLYPGANLCGEICVCELGIDLAPAATCARLADEALLRLALPPRARRTHKGTYGWLVLLCGSVGMSGAAVLATRAALRCGVGVARVLTPPDHQLVLRATVPEAIVTAYDTPAAAAGFADGDAFVLGCGLGATPFAGETLKALLELPHKESPIPMVLDADALNLLAKDPTLWDTAALRHPQKRVVITPHPMEMSRLCGLPVPAILADPVGVATEYARQRGVTVVLKDAHTVIASPDGELYLCAAGNAGMAKGGSGDVLAGVIGALLSQNGDRVGKELSVAALSAAGVYLHAAAGDLAAERLGEYGLLASDVAECLPLITRSLSDSRTVITRG